VNASRVELYLLVDGFAAHVAHLEFVATVGAHRVAAQEGHVPRPLHADGTHDVLLHLVETPRHRGVGRQIRLAAHRGQRAVNTDHYVPVWKRE